MADKAASSMDLVGFVNDFQALLWRIEVAKSRIDYLNDWRIDSLGDSTKRILKDPELRKKIVYPEDRHLFDVFLDKVKMGQQASAVFRITAQDGGCTWLKLIGTPSSKNPGYYSGFLLDVSDTASTVASILENADNSWITIEQADYPVLLVDFQNKRVAAVNSGAQTLFGYSLNEFRSLSLAEIYHPHAMGEINRMNESVLFERLWSGPLQLLRKSRAPFLADAEARLINHKGRRLLRLSLLDIRHMDKARNENGAPSPPGAAAGPDKHSGLLMSRLAGLDRMEDLLRVFLDHRPQGLEYEGILFSDVYAKKNKVIVYHSGGPFGNMKQGEVFSYQGTIAENIERFKLDHLIVDETLDSIKSIDWALFIPKGIRSYFAKAFYIRGVMRSVMILCSTSPESFSGSRLMDYAKLYLPFEKAIQHWRRAKRKQ